MRNVTSPHFVNDKLYNAFTHAAKKILDEEGWCKVTCEQCDVNKWIIKRGRK